MDRPQGLLGVFAGHEHRDLDLAGGDHLDVDALLGQGAEHPLGHAGLRGHAQADDRNLRHLVVAVVAFGAQFLDGLFDRAERVRQIVAEHREGDVGPAVGGHVLGDHVHGDVLGRDLGRRCVIAAPGRSGTPSTVTRASFLIIAAPQTGMPGRLRLADDHRARLVAEAAADVDRHAELLGELDRAVVHHAGPGRGQFQHLVVADLAEAAGPRARRGDRSCRRRPRRCRFRRRRHAARRPGPRPWCRCRRGPGS